MKVTKNSPLDYKFCHHVRGYNDNFAHETSDYKYGCTPFIDAFDIMSIDLLTSMCLAYLCSWLLNCLYDGPISHYTYKGEKRENTTCSVKRKYPWTESKS